VRPNMAILLLVQLLITFPLLGVRVVGVNQREADSREDHHGGVPFDYCTISHRAEMKDHQYNLC